MNPNFRNFALWIIIILLVVAVVMLFQNPGQRVPSQDIAFSQLLNEVDQGHVREVTIAGNEITGHFTDNRAFATYAPNDPTLVQSLYKKNVSITAKPPSENTNWLMTLLVNVLPLIAIIGVWIFLSRRMQGGAGTAMGLGKSKAKLLTEVHGRATFEDVAGVDEAKEDLQEIVEFLRDPQRFQKLGGRIPRGVLLVGPPGTGKTLLARAIAGEANVPFFTISGSDFVEMFVGVGASRVRDMFVQAKTTDGCWSSGSGQACLSAIPLGLSRAELKKEQRHEQVMVGCGGSCGDGFADLRAFRMRTLMRRQRIAKQQHHAAALDDTWIDFSAYSISRKTISEKWAMLDAGVHVRNCSARRSTSHC